MGAQSFDEIQSAERRLAAEFVSAANGLISKCGGVLSDERWVHVSVNSYYGKRKSVNFFILADGEPAEIRLSMESEDMLQVGWGGNNLLTTHCSHFDTYQIETIKFVAEVFKHEAEWRSVLVGLDDKPLLLAQQKKADAEAHAREVERQANLLSYESAELCGSFNFHEKVIRVSRNKVQIGKELYDKEAVGKKLREGVWQVV